MLVLRLLRTYSVDSSSVSARGSAKASTLHHSYINTAVRAVAVQTPIAVHFAVYCYVCGMYIPEDKLHVHQLQQRQ